MAEVVKSCDLAGDIAARLFEMLNHNEVQYTLKGGMKVLVTNTEPSELIYPEGWYYAKGALRNKHNSTTGFYDEVYMVNSSGDMWGNIAKYSTQ